MAFVVYSYVGFGDHLICYGIIKEFAKQHDKIEYRSDLMDPIVFKNCKRLFSNIPNVELIKEPIEIDITPLDHKIAHTRLWYTMFDPFLKDPSVPFACNIPQPEWYNQTWNFDYHWYLNANVPYNLKWDNFYFERDLEKEKEVYYDQLGLKDNEEFILMFEDTYRSYTINRNYINPNIKLIDLYNLRHISILDILYTVEKAKEFHTINTGILIYIDQMNIQHNKLYYHKYNRSCFWDQPGLRLNWKIID